MLDFGLLYKLAEDFESEIELIILDPNQLLSAIVQKLNEYSETKNLETGREALKLVDQFKHAISEQMTQDWLASKSQLNPWEEKMQDQLKQTVIKRRKD